MSRKFKLHIKGVRQPEFGFTESMVTRSAVVAVKPYRGDGKRQELDYGAWLEWSSALCSRGMAVRELGHCTVFCPVSVN